MSRTLRTVLSGDKIEDRTKVDIKYRKLIVGSFVWIIF